MGDVIFRLTAEEGKAVQGFMSLIDAQRKAEAGARGLSQAGRQTTGVFEQMGKSAVRDISSMVMGYVSVGAAIAAVRSGINATIEDMKRLADQNTGVTKTLTETIANAGDTINADQVRRFLLGDRFQGTSTSIKERTGVWAAVRGAMPSEALPRAMDVAAVAARAHRAGLDTAAFGRTAGELAKLMPATGAEDIGDLAAFFEEMQGRHGQRIVESGWRALEKWKAADLGPIEQGLGLVLASMEARQGSVAFEALQGKLTEEKKFKKTGFGQKVTDEENRERAFYGMAAPERLAALRTDEQVRKDILGPERAGVEAMFGRDPEEFTRKAILAQKNNRLRFTEMKAMQDERWESVMETEEQESLAEQAEYERNQGRAMENVRRTVAYMRQENYPAFLRSFARTGGQISAALNIPKWFQGLPRTSVTVPWVGPVELNPFAGVAAVVKESNSKWFDASKQLDLGLNQPTTAPSPMDSAAAKIGEAADRLGGPGTPQFQSQVLD